LRGRASGSWTTKTPTADGAALVEAKGGRSRSSWRLCPETSAAPCRRGLRGMGVTGLEPVTPSLSRWRYLSTNTHANCESASDASVLRAQTEGRHTRVTRSRNACASTLDLVWTRFGSRESADDERQILRDAHGSIQCLVFDRNPVELPQVVRHGNLHRVPKLERGGVGGEWNAGRVHQVDAGRSAQCLRGGVVGCGKLLAQPFECSADL